jgi:hypothetical protein
MEDKEITVQVPRTVEVPVTKMVPRTVLVPVTVMQPQVITETESRTIQVTVARLHAPWGCTCVEMPRLRTPLA